MTETPSDPVGPGESSSEYGSAPPPPPPPAGAGYPAAPPSSYSGAEGQGYQPPPAYQPPPPGAEAPAAQPPLVADPAQYQAAPGYQPVPPAGYQEPPAAATGFGQQFSNYDRTTLRSFNPRTVDPLDWGIIAAGLIAFIFSLFQFYKYTLSVAGVGRASESVSAWHGFFGWFGALV